MSERLMCGRKCATCGKVFEISYGIDDVGFIMNPSFSDPLCEHAIDLLSSSQTDGVALGLVIKHVSKPTRSERSKGPSDYPDSTLGAFPYQPSGVELPRRTYQDPPVWDPTEAVMSDPNAKSTLWVLSSHPITTVYTLKFAKSVSQLELTEPQALALANALLRAVKDAKR